MLTRQIFHTAGSYRSVGNGWRVGRSSRWNSSQRDARSCCIGRWFSSTTSWEMAVFSAPRLKKDPE